MKKAQMEKAMTNDNTNDSPPTATVTYVGDLRTEGKHLQSGAQIVTDAPTDNHGKGEAFSPTDLVATALGSCMLTIMGIKADDMGVNLKGATAKVVKIMSANPRRIAEVVVTISLPADLDDKTRKILQAAAHTCPVAQSLHPETRQTVSFEYRNL